MHELVLSMRCFDGFHMQTNTGYLEDMCHVSRHVPGSAVCALAWLVMDSEGALSTAVKMTYPLVNQQFAIGHGHL